jgi:uncharacterized protein
VRKNHEKPLAILTLFLLLSLIVSVDPGRAQQEQKPSQSADLQTPATASPSHLAAARALVIACGMSRSFGVIVPQFMGQIGSSLTQTRPELKSDLSVVLNELKPEFDRKVDEMIYVAAQIYVKQMSEQDLNAAVAFFESPAGRHYVETQPAFVTQVVAAMQGWRGKVSTDLMARVRAEMRKRGHEI